MWVINRLNDFGYKLTQEFINSNHYQKEEKLRSSKEWKYLDQFYKSYYNEEFEKQAKKLKENVYLLFNVTPRALYDKYCEVGEIVNPVDKKIKDQKCRVELNNGKAEIITNDYLSNINSLQELMIGITIVFLNQYYSLLNGKVPINGHNFEKNTDLSRQEFIKQKRENSILYKRYTDDTFEIADYVEEDEIIKGMTFFNNEAIEYQSLIELLENGYSRKDYTEQEVEFLITFCKSITNSYEYVYGATILDKYINAILYTYKNCRSKEKFLEKANQIIKEKIETNKQKLVEIQKKIKVGKKISTEEQGTIIEIINNLQLYVAGKYSGVEINIFKEFTNETMNTTLDLFKFDLSNDSLLNILCIDMYSKTKAMHVNDPEKGTYEYRDIQENMISIFGEVLGDEFKNKFDTKYEKFYKRCYRKELNPYIKHKV